MWHDDCSNDAHGLLQFWPSAARAGRDKEATEDLELVGCNHNVLEKNNPIELTPFISFTSSRRCNQPGAQVQQDENFN